MSKYRVPLSITIIVEMEELDENKIYDYAYDLFKESYIEDFEMGIIEEIEHE